MRVDWLSALASVGLAVLEVSHPYLDSLSNGLSYLINRMVENPAVITRATYLIWAAHNIERIADRATNISESVVYLVTGTPGEMNVSRY